jgi:hypothetical protein
MSDMRIHKMQQNPGHLLGALQGKMKRTVTVGRASLLINKSTRHVGVMPKI